MSRLYLVTETRSEDRAPSAAQWVRAGSSKEAIRKANYLDVRTGMVVAVTEKRARLLQEGELTRLETLREAEVANPLEDLQIELEERGVFSYMRLVTMADSRTEENVAKALTFIAHWLLAYEGAKRHFSSAEDCGSCNLDSPMIRLPEPVRLAANRMRARQGHTCCVSEPWPEEHGSLWAGWSSVEFPAQGQADRRRLRAEYVHSILRGHGYEMRMFYQLD